MNEEIKKLHEQMTNRYNALKVMIDKDMLGDTSKLYERFMETKYWKEFVERTFRNDSK